MKFSVLLFIFCLSSLLYGEEYEDPFLQEVSKRSSWFRTAGYSKPFYTGSLEKEFSLRNLDDVYSYFDLVPLDDLSTSLSLVSFGLFYDQISDEFKRKTLALASASAARSKAGSRPTDYEVQSICGRVLLRKALWDLKSKDEAVDRVVTEFVANQVVTFTALHYEFRRWGREDLCTKFQPQLVDHIKAGSGYISYTFFPACLLHSTEREELLKAVGSFSPIFDYGNYHTLAEGIKLCCKADGNEAVLVKLGEFMPHKSRRVLCLFLLNWKLGDEPKILAEDQSLSEAAGLNVYYPNKDQYNTPVKAGALLVSALREAVTYQHKP